MQTITIDLDDEVILVLALEAHELDITLNEHICNILREYCTRAEQENST